MSAFRCAVSTLLLLVVTSYSDGADSCECNIGYSPNSTTAFCSGKALESVPDCLPVNTTALYISFNYLTDLSSSMLDQVPFLKTLSVTDNGLNQIYKDTFIYVQFLEEFDAVRNELRTLPFELFMNTPNIVDVNLAMNKLVSVHGDLFRNNPKLRILRLFKNYLIELQPEQFAYNPQLTEVFLSDNMLTALPADIFANNVNLEYIDIARNRLTQISYDMFKNTIATHIYVYENQISTVENVVSLLTEDSLEVLGLNGNNLTTIDLEGEAVSENYIESIWLEDNPWYCDCKLKEAYNLLLEKNVEYLEEPVCASPPIMSGSTWSEILPKLSCQTS